MWKCCKCQERLNDSFAICWQCGTDRHGKEDPAFQIVRDDDLVAAEEKDDVGPRGWQFSLKALFVLISAIAIFIGVLRGLPAFVPTVVACIFVANAFGVLVALFVTHVLKIPNDGT